MTTKTLDPLSVEEHPGGGEEEGEVEVEVEESGAGGGCSWESPVRRLVQVNTERVQLL